MPSTEPDRPNPSGATRRFLLSPAFLGGRRGEALLSGSSLSPLARRLEGAGAPLGEVYAFVSALYFRGKLAYARQFASAPDDVRIITPTRGLAPPDALVTTADLREFAGVDLERQPAEYVDALRRSALEWIAPGRQHIYVLLGSVATGKYSDVLLEVLGDSLAFPTEFVGRGDMSRGGLLLRTSAAGTELEYTRLRDAVKRGSRPPRLPKL